MDPILNIDDNPVENGIQPVAIGRKNYLFADSYAAAQRAAMFILAAGYLPYPQHQPVHLAKRRTGKNAHLYNSQYK